MNLSVRLSALFARAKPPRKPWSFIGPVAVAIVASSSVPTAGHDHVSDETSAPETVVTSAVLRTAIVVTDADLSKRFYMEVFGFEAGFDGDISKPVNRELLGLDPDETARFVILRGGRDIAGFEVSANAIGLLEIEGETVRSAILLPEGNGLSPGQTMFAMVTDDIEGVITRLREFGAPIVAGPVIAGDGSEIEIVTRDPDGMRIHVVQRRDAP